MTFNVGVVDKTIRAIVGLGLISLVFFGPETPWGWVGLIPLATVLMGWCPLYSIVGISTKRKASSNA
jgi:hypothetical protein